MGGSGGVGGLLGVLQNRQGKIFNTGEDPTAKEVGKSQSADVYVATQEETDAIGPFGLPLPAVRNPVTPQEGKSDLEGANQVLQDFDKDNKEVAGIFNQKPITDFKVYVEPPVNIIDPKTGKPVSLGAGASHPFSQPEEPEHFEDNITTRISPDGDGAKKASGLTSAEMVESYEDRTNNWDASLTSGEALSRALSFSMHPELAKDPAFSTKPMQAWWADKKDENGKIIHAGKQDYINGNPDFDSGIGTPLKNPSGTPVQFDDHGGFQTQNQASDVNPYSNGSGTLFLQYMHDKLGYNWNQIVSANGNTLGEKYQSLTGKSGQQGFNDFVNALPTVPGDSGKLDLPTNGSSPFTMKNEAVHAVNQGVYQVKQAASGVWNWVKGHF